MKNAVIPRKIFSCFFRRVTERTKKTRTKDKKNAKYKNLIPLYTLIPLYRFSVD
jgi:hypothetical protein